MNRRKKFTWLIRPRGFIRLLGAEYDLMRNAGGAVLMKFYIASFLIFIIAILSFLSIWYAVELLFHMVSVEIAMSTFLSTLFVLIYIFLINTFSKESERKTILNFSNITRTGFVVFMGFIISKPIEIFMFKDQISGDVSLYKQQLREEHNEKIAQLFETDKQKLEQLEKHYTELNVGGLFNREINSIQSRLYSLNKKRDELIESSYVGIEKGAFFIYRIRMVIIKYPISWLICIGLIILFILPGLLIYSISKGDEYYKLKSELEKGMIERAYKAFCEKYSFIFKKKYGLQLEFYSRYEDPPFNKKLKRHPSCKYSNDFFNRYGNN